MRRAEVRATALVAAEGEATQPDRAHLHFKLGWWALLRELRVVSYLEATRTEISVLHAVYTDIGTFFFCTDWEAWEGRPRIPRPTGV